MSRHNTKNMEYKIYWKVVTLQNLFYTLCLIKKCELESRNLIRGLINDFGYRDYKRSLIYDVAKYLLRTRCVSLPIASLRTMYYSTGDFRTLTHCKITIIQMKNRPCRWRCSVKKAFLKYFAIFTGKNLCWCLFLIKL